MNKLPVILLLREAYSFIWTRYSAFRLLAFPAIVILAIAETALAAWGASVWEGLGPVADPPTPEQMEAANTMASVTAVHWLLSIALVVLFSVAWYRVCLVATESPTIGSAYRWTMRHWRFVISFLKVISLIFPAALLVGVLIIGIAGQGGSPDHIATTAWAPMMLIGTWLYARFSLLFPAASVDRDLTVGQGWALTKGNGLSLLLITFLAAAPGFVAVYIVLQLKFLMDVESLSLGLLFSLAIQFCNFVAIGAGVTILALAYDRLSRKLPARMPIDV